MAGTCEGELLGSEPCVEGNVLILIDAALEGFLIGMVLVLLNDQLCVNVVVIAQSICDRQKERWNARLDDNSVVTLPGTIKKELYGVGCDWLMWLYKVRSCPSLSVWVVSMHLNVFLFRAAALSLSLV